jgi:hypothetical protein
MTFVQFISSGAVRAPIAGTRTFYGKRGEHQMVMLLGALGIAWLSAVAVVLGLCISAARGDRAMRREPSAMPVHQRGGLRLIA